MKRVISLSLVASVVLAGNAAAEVSLTEKTVLNGDVRVLYYSEEAATSENALGLGFNPTITQDCLFTDKLKWEIGAGVALHLSESSDGASSEYSMTRTPESGDNSEHHATMTKLNGTYDYGSGFVKVGYQLLDTPMAGSDDIRLIPNSYFAGVIGYTGVNNLTLLAAQVTHMAGMVDSQAEGPENYHSMSDAALAGVTGKNTLVDDAGVTALAALYTDEEAGINGQFWYYAMPDAGVQIGTNDLGAVSAVYLDAGMALDAVTLTAQYMTFATDLWSNSAMGLMGEAGMGDFSLTVAANSFSFTDNGIGGVMTPAWYAWGGYPEFVAGEEVDASMADWDGGTASMAAVGYEGIENLGLTLAYFSYSDAVSAVDAVAEYALNNSTTAQVIYETKDFEVATGEEDTDTLEVKLYYNF